MLHEHIPILKDGESVCSSCGHVLEITQIYESENLSGSIKFAYKGLDSLLLGTSFAKIGYWQSPTNKDLLNKERVGKFLLDICREFNMNERIAYETIRRMLKENRGFYSTHKQIRALCEVIRASENIRYIITIQKIREKYDKNSPSD